MCRLFKENKNLNEDILKVDDERREIYELIKSLLFKLEQNEFKEFEKEILSMLEGHNKLEEFQKKEKELIFKIKKIKTEIAQENHSYQQEMNEKNQNIQTMKDQYNKTFTQKEIHIKYRKKELEAS